MTRPDPPNSPRAARRDTAPDPSGSELRPPPAPLHVVHADWGKAPAKRWQACAWIDPDGRIEASAPVPVEDAAGLLASRSRIPGRDAPALFGFDFPIGLPVAYARRAGIADFPGFLNELAAGRWPDFARLAERPEQIGPGRPFYPSGQRGVRQSHLLAGHGVEELDALRRRCERARPGRRAASPLFWTLGGQQVGRAALAGWLETLLPALERPDLDVALWPFEGRLESLLATRAVTVAETYPAEFYGHLGLELRGSKRRRTDRAAQADDLHRWARRSRVGLSAALAQEIDEGFGDRPDGEDRFDAVVGLLGMLGVLLGRRPSGEPTNDPELCVEGWILGVDHRLLIRESTS